VSALERRSPRQSAPKKPILQLHVAWKHTANALIVLTVCCCAKLNFDREQFFFKLTRRRTVIDIVLLDISR
jgi:hypothetical protein